MINGWQKLTFKQTKAELMVRIASTLIFNKLVKANAKTVSVREITESVQYGYTDKSSVAEIGPKYVRITDLKDGQVNWETVPYCRCEDPEQYLLKKGDLIFARTGATTGKTHLFRETPPTAVFASYLIRVRPTKEINPEYLYFFFQSDLYWSQISSQKEGSAQPNVNGQKLSNIELPITDEETQMAICKFLAITRARQDGVAHELPELPYPLNEQRHLLEQVEVLAARIVNAQSLRDEANEETGFLHGSFAAKVLNDVSNSPKYSIGDICEVRGGIQKSPARLPNTNPTPYLTVAHVQRNHIDISSPTRYFEVSPDELPRWKLEFGDLLIIEGNGSEDQIGRVALYRGELGICVHQNHVIRARPNKKIVSSEYLNMYMNSPLGQDEVQRRSRTTSGLRTLSVGRIREIEIPVPTLDKQQSIVAYLDKVQLRLAPLRRLQSDIQKELDALLPSVLDKAFKGEL